MFVMRPKLDFSYGCPYVVVGRSLYFAAVVSFFHSFGLNNTVQDIKVTKTLTYVLRLNTKHQHDIVR